MSTYRIHRVAKIAGLSTDVIRVWERRYGLFNPERSRNRYRMYTDEDVTLLKYLRAEMAKGHSIGELAALGREALLQQLRQAPAARSSQEPFTRLLADLIAALDPLDRSRFERQLNGAVAVIPFEEALHRILLPLQERVGELWHAGRVSVAVEHYVTKVVQQKLFSVMNILSGSEEGPEVVIACPSGEFHEIGAQAAAYLCAARRCRVYYLGPDVPVKALSAFCSHVHPELIVLAMTALQPGAETSTLVHELSTEVGRLAPIAVGGSATQSLAPLLREANIEILDNLFDLERRVAQLFPPPARRSPARESSLR
jgi:MerR family transcriptional regulator, light-induced transcriptional regulator